jgi:imidazolonepropionase-like amidohydrolase
MTPEQALKAATSNGAELLGKGQELGAVAPGYLADLVAVEGDPLASGQKIGKCFRMNSALHVGA